MFAQLCLFIEFFFYIYTNLGPDNPSLLSFIQFPQVSNRYLMSCGNATGDNDCPYLISSEKKFCEIFTQIKQINVVYYSLYDFSKF